MPDRKMEDLGVLPFSGAHLYRERNADGGWTYYSDEHGCMSKVWDTHIADEHTLLAAILCEHHRRCVELVFNVGLAPNIDTQEQVAATGGSLSGPLNSGSIDHFTIGGSGTLNCDPNTLGGMKDPGGQDKPNV